MLIQTLIALSTACFTPDFKSRDISEHVHLCDDSHFWCPSRLGFLFSDQNWCSAAASTRIFSAGAANSEFDSHPKLLLSEFNGRQRGSEAETQIFQIFAKMESEISDFPRQGCRRGHCLFIDQLKEKRVVPPALSVTGRTSATSALDVVRRIETFTTGSTVWRPPLSGGGGCGGDGGKGDKKVQRLFSTSPASEKKKKNPHGGAAELALWVSITLR